MPASLNDEVTFISTVNPDGTLALTSFDAWNGATPAGYSAGFINAKKWGGITAGTSGGTVYYYFDPASNWNSTEQNFLAAGLALWSDIANISFTLTANPAQAQINFTRGSSGTAGTSTSGADTSPGGTAGRTGGAYFLHMTSATISIDTNVATFGPIDGNFATYGGFPIDTFLHEEGHAIGLGHAGPYNGIVHPATEQFGPYDTRLWSIMSYIEPRTTTAAYFNQYPVTGTDWGFNQSGFRNEPTTWMPLDILAAQALYGLPTSTPLSGGQTFGFNCNIQGPSEMFFDFTKNTNPVITIWDMGTNNTLDISGFSTNSTINLNPGTFSSCDGLINNICIAFNTAIDRFVGGSGNDTVTANNNGDTLTGGLGNNTLIGGTGFDRAVYSSNYAAYTITHNSNGSVTVAGLGLTDTLANIEETDFADGAVAIDSNVAGISVSNASVSEGGVLHFGMTLSAAASQNITLSYDTFLGTASMADNDYLGGPGTFTILAGQTTGTINIQTVQDSKVEPDETMSVHLLTTSFGIITQGVATGTIVNDDAAPGVPNISIGNASVAEGGVLHFGVTLSGAASQNITLSYDTFAGTASMADNDYLGGPGTLTILAGQTTGTINIQTVQDSKVEPDETMSMHLLTASFGNVTQGVGTGTIVNVTSPNISIGNASVSEGGVLHFGVTLSAAAAQNITLGYDTFAGTASMANNDYLGGLGTLTIQAGQTTGTINIQTVQDSTVEADETMSVHLLTASFGNITQGTGTGTIVNDDAAPVVPNISIGNASVTEGGVLQFGVTLSAATSQNITLGYDTFLGTASMADNDYLGGPASLTVLAGQTAGTINIQTVQDSKVEPDETMSVHLLTANFGNITQGVGTGTIVNDDVVPNISIGNASVTEGGVLHFGVTLSAAASQNITLGYDTFLGTASMANNDYLGGPGSLTILAGQTTGTINIQTVQDFTVEPDETMSVHLLTASLGNITQAVGTGTIVNDDVVPNISIGNASATEGNVLHFGVTLDQAASQNITLGYDTFFGTASMANNDYLGGPGSLTILAGQITGTINIQTVQDGQVEPDETMSVHLLTTNLGNITQGIGTGTILSNSSMTPPFGAYSNSLTATLAGIS